MSKARPLFSFIRYCPLTIKSKKKANGAALKTHNIHSATTTMNPPIDLSASAGSKQEGSIALSKEEDALMKQQLAYAQGLQFPWRLHVLLEITQKRGQGHIISWLPKGKSFRVHDKREFSVQIMPTFFCSSIYKTFQRNLTLWGFHTASKGIDKGMCTHDFFIRGKPELCSLMKRVRIKSCKKAQQNSDPDASKSKSGDADLRGESKKSAAPTTVSRGHQDNSMKTYTSKPSAYEDLFCPQLPTGIGMVPNSAIARVSNQASNPTIRTCASLDPNPFRNNSIRRPAPNPALPVPHALQENLQSMSVQLLQEMAARFSGNTSLTSGATQQHSRLMQTASLLSRADVFSRHVQQAQQQQQQQQQQALVLQGQQQSPVDFLSVGDMGITANPRPRPFHQATPSTTNAAPVSVPETVGRRISCRARAMPVDHNPNVNITPIFGNGSYMPILKFCPN